MVQFIIYRQLQRLQPKDIPSCADRGKQGLPDDLPKPEFLVQHSELKGMTVLRSPTVRAVLSTGCQLCGTGGDKETGITHPSVPRLS
jgi:hypothetical protein